MLTTGFTSLVIPGLMIAAAILARHNVKLGRGDRKGAFRAAAVLFWVGVLAQDIMLATIVTLATHFMLLRAPLTLDFSSWRAAPGITYVVVVAVVGLGAAYVARTGTPASPSRDAVTAPV